jgi:hypothetical protein
MRTSPSASAREVELVRSRNIIAITPEAFEAIARTLPLGSVEFENATNERGERLIRLDPAVIDRLRSLRGTGESFSDVILRIAGRDAPRIPSC